MEKRTDSNFSQFAEKIISHFFFYNSENYAWCKILKEFAITSGDWVVLPKEVGYTPQYSHVKTLDINVFKS